MAYIPNADDENNPLDAEFAASAAAEFRALKKKVNGLWKSSGYNPNENSMHFDVSLAIFNLNQDNGTNVVYSVLGLATRKGGTGHIAGGYFSASMLDNVFLQAGAAVHGILVEASTSTVSSDTPRLVGANIFATQRNPSGNDRVLGISTTFQNRSVGLGTIAGTIGDNKFNINAVAFIIQSQRRSSAGEHCGWKIGIRFEDFALDSDWNGELPVGIDFTGLGHCDTAGDPITGFKCTPFHFDAESLSIHDAAGTGAIPPPANINGWIPILVNGIDYYGIPCYELDFTTLGTKGAGMKTKSPRRPDRIISEMDPFWPR